jgi:zona occludens toxin
MITLITGQPGNGKTLYALDMIAALAKKDNRPVYQFGIKECKLPWQLIEPEKWFDAPPGSIVVIDECQEIFRSRTLGKEPPEFVKKLETHRHMGIDLFMITQHPMLADTALRRLSGRHLHVIRKWGTQSATVHEWASVKDNCDKTAGRVDSIKHAYKYNREVFNWYKSAELHTVKRSIPARVYMLGVMALLVAGIVYGVGHWMIGKTTKPVPEALAGIGKASLPGAPVAAPGAAAGASKVIDPIQDAKDFIFQHTARVSGVPATAPRYDQLTVATVVPVPAACVSMGKRCQCFSQQGTRLETKESMCLEIVAHGFFEDFERGKPGASSPVLASQPAVSGAAVVVPSHTALSVRS